MSSINQASPVNDSIINYNGSSQVYFVPSEIWKLIASFFNDIKDVISLGRSNRQLSVILRDTLLWEILLQKDFRDSSANRASNLPAPAFYKELVIIAKHMKTPEHYRLQTLTRHDGTVKDIAIYEGNLVSASSNGIIKICDLKTREVKGMLQANAPIERIAIYDRTKIISASTDNDSIQILDLGTGKSQTFNTNQPGISCFAVYDDQLFCGSFDRTIKVVNLKTEQEEIQTLDLDQLWINSITASAGKLFSCASDCSIKVYDLKTKEVLTLEGHQQSINCMAVWDNTLISCSSDGTIKIWDFNTGELLRTLVGHDNSVEKIIVNDDRLISTSWDRTIKIWDLNTGKVLQTLELETLLSCITFYDGKIIASLFNRTIMAWDFKFPSHSSCSRQTLEENLEILGEMAHLECTQQPQAVEALAEKLHPDFQKRLKQHSLNVGAPFCCSAKAMSRVQTEVCIEALLHAVHVKDHSRVSQLLEQIICINPQNAEIDELREYVFSNQQNCPASIIEKEEAILELKRNLTDKWKAEDLSLLVNLGIVTKKEYSAILSCTPEALSKRGIHSNKDLQVLFNSPHFQSLKPLPEKATKDRIELRTRAFAKQKVVLDLLDQLLAAAQQKSEETKQCSVCRDENNNVFDAPNPWTAFQKTLMSYQVSLSQGGLTPEEFSAKFNSESYTKIIEEANAFIDEFRQLERGTQILRLRAYLSQVDILAVWASLKSENIESLSILVEKGMTPPDLFAMGK